MNEMLTRVLPLLGEEGVDKLNKASVLVVGAGGVGGSVIEALARSGVGKITVMDGDCFELSNLNRQLLATRQTIGRNKAEVAVERIRSISNSIAAAYTSFYDDTSAQTVLREKFDYCVDAIDSPIDKTQLILDCKARNINIISALGAGNRTTCDFEVVDLFSTKNDPLARVMRQKLKDKISSLKTVCAKTVPEIKSREPASFCSAPMVMGALIAAEVIGDLCRDGKM